jgi:hypothetical protein
MIMKDAQVEWIQNLRMLRGDGLWEQLLTLGALDILMESTFERDDGI